MSATGDRLAFVNACLNGTAALCIALGYLAIRRRDRVWHARMMGSAFVVSSIFLVSYLTRVWLTGTHRYPGQGMWRAIYLSVLGSHMLLAVITPPLVIRTIYLALKNRLAEHRKIVRFTLPIWMYVSVTGVVVYVLLYHPPG